MSSSNLICPLQFPQVQSRNRRISLQNSIKHKMGRRKVMFKCIYDKLLPRCQVFVQKWYCGITLLTGCIFFLATWCCCPVYFDLLKISIRFSIDSQNPYISQVHSRVGYNCQCLQVIIQYKTLPQSEHHKRSPS